MPIYLFTLQWVRSLAWCDVVTAQNVRYQKAEIKTSTRLSSPLEVLGERLLPRSFRVAEFSSPSNL